MGRYGCLISVIMVGFIIKDVVSRFVVCGVGVNGTLGQILPQVTHYSNQRNCTDYALGVVAQGSETKVNVEMRGHDVVLKCKGSKEEPIITNWYKDDDKIADNRTEWNLGAEANDPRGMYRCEESKYLQIYFRNSPPGCVSYKEPSCIGPAGEGGGCVICLVCQNCIELDAATISGIVVADVIATVFLAVAVYCITGQDSGRLSRASDRQNLIANEQLYQPLGERDNEQYSRLGVTRTRK